MSVETALTKAAELQLLIGGVVREEKSQDLKARAAVFRDRLCILGVTAVVVEYSGSGDSGDIDGVTAYGLNPKKKDLPIPDRPVLDISDQWIMIRQVDSQWNPQTKEYEHSEKMVKKSLAEAMGDLATDVLEAMGVDWYNNEGGFGKMVFDLTGGSVEVKAEHNHRVESTEYHEYIL